MTQPLFPEIKTDYGGLRWTVSFDSRQISVRAAHPAMGGFAFDKKYPISPNDFSDTFRVEHSAELVRLAAKSLGLKVED